MAGSNPVTQSSDNKDVTGKIQHVFVLMMENRSFDHVFGRYTASDSDSQKLDNLINSGWINRSLTDVHGKSFAIGDAMAKDHVTPDPPH